MKFQQQKTKVAVFFVLFIYKNKKELNLLKCTENDDRCIFFAEKSAHFDNKQHKLNKINNKKNTKNKN